MAVKRSTGTTRPSAGISRRRLFRDGGLVTAATVAAAGRPGSALAADARPAAAGKMRLGADLYRSLGVRPFINCKGTYTVLSGSQSLPEVKRAMEEASRHYVVIDELMEAVGGRLAELTKAEWGIVTAGCAAALSHATAACITGGDPEKLQRLPDLTGLPNEVVTPASSRNDYDQAIRALGARLVTVETPQALEAALSPRTAMIMVLSGPAAESGPLSTDAIVRIARKRAVPVLVDAAAEFLTIPSVHLQRGANLVGYSGGKCLRGPQCAGMLLGDKSLVKAAWLASAPHHGLGRSMKVGKEEIVGMLAAVEMWIRRDHDREWRTWEGWLHQIAARVGKVPGVTTELVQPAGLVDRSPQLRVRWDVGKMGITDVDVEAHLRAGDPRIILADADADDAGDDGGNRGSVTIVPYMMMPGDERVVADALFKLLRDPPKRAAVPPSPSLRVQGHWEVRLEFARGQASHQLQLEQSETRITGTHRSPQRSGPVEGRLEGDTVHLHSRLEWDTRGVAYNFTGRIEGARIAGLVKLGEYGEARWTAVRRAG
jgi:L-seryl-tRNA(Ser) seleniumtransferase